MNITINIFDYYGNLYHTEKINTTKTPKYFRFVKNTTADNFHFCTYDENKSKLTTSTHTYVYSRLMGLTDTSGFVFTGLSYGVNSRFADAMKNETDANGKPYMNYHYTDYGTINPKEDESFDLFGSLEAESNYNISTGGFTVFFGVNTSGSNYINKNVTWIKEDKKDKEFKILVIDDEISMVNPKFKIYVGGNTFNANYCKIPKFNRYYYINNISYSEGYALIDCKVDVLTTYANEIKNSLISLARCEYGYDTKLHDSSIPVETNAQVDFFTGTGVYNTIFNKASADDISILAVGEFEGDT